MQALPILYLLFLPLLAYLLGAIPFGLLLTTLFTTKNIRNHGSGNIGATNVLRTAGIKLGAATLMADMAKGAIPVGLATAPISAYDGWTNLYLIVVAIAAFVGHLFPVYTKFQKGGKGVATALGCFVIISPGAAAISVLVFVMTICFSNRVSMGSLAGVAVLPLAIWKINSETVMTAGALIVAVLIFYRHRANILRIINGAEPPIWKH